MWNSSIDFEELTKSAKIACIHDWILNRPMGYDHKISEDGSNIMVEKKPVLKLPVLLPHPQPYWLWMKRLRVWIRN